jgi:hypothetical protein
MTMLLWVVCVMVVLALGLLLWGLYLIGQDDGNPT